MFVIISCQGNKRSRLLLLWFCFALKKELFCYGNGQSQYEVSIIMYNTGRISFVFLPVISKCFINKIKNKNYQTVEFDLFHWR